LFYEKINNLMLKLKALEMHFPSPSFLFRQCSSSLVVLREQLASETERLMVLASSESSWRKLLQPWRALACDLPNPI
jgi:hypothetical protein